MLLGVSRRPGGYAAGWPGPRVAVAGAVCLPSEPVASTVTAGRPEPGDRRRGPCAVETGRRVSAW